MRDTEISISINKRVAASQNIKERDYWLNKLSEKPEKSFFPYDDKKTGEAEIKPVYHSVKFRFTNDIFSRLVRISNKSDHRLHLVLTAGLVVLMGIYTGSKDIIVGIPVFKQEDKGNFVNTILALRNNLDANMTFKELLLQVRQSIAEAVKNQNYPIEAILEKLNMSFSDNNFPLFDAAILLESIHERNNLENIRLNMMFSFLKTGQYIEGTVEYNASLYHKTTIERITRHWRQLFREVFKDLNIPLADIDILPENEKNQVLFAFNNTSVDHPQNRIIHQLLENQVEKIPDHTAVVYRDRYLTYLGLNEIANRLARLLKEKGVRTDESVGLLVEPSLEMIIGIVGILKAGGAYLPIDPQYPVKRISSILKDSCDTILLTREKTINTIAIHDKKLKIPDTLKVLLLDQVWQGLERYSRVNPDHINQPGDLLYLISTSGSTGVPKSLMMEHRNLANLLYFQLLDTPVDFRRVLQFASIGFDVSAQEIFSTLLSGGELYLVDNETKRDAYRLLEVMRKNYLNVVYWPPAFLKYVFSEPDYRNRFPTSIEHIITAGEQLVITGPIRRYIKENHVYLHNHYGPAETHVVTTFVIDPGGNIPEMPPIGKPIANTRTYILDENKKVKPIGTLGELYIAGAGVGRGYHRNRELTAEKFIDLRDLPDLPTQPPNHSTIYRTGDLARWLADGSIEFIGRADYQVKIRGFRIELGEIETRLMEIAALKEAVVVDYNDPAGEKFLCAYFVSEQEVGIREIKHILSNELPDYMIPSYFVPLEKIPVTSNGKIDKKALPMPKFEKDKTYAAPGNKVEKELALIWSEVLGVEKSAISIDANFFDLGGHSLKATILITRIHKAFNVKVTLGEMFAVPTIRGLAQLIKEAGGDIFTAIPLAEKKEYYPLSSAQKRIYILQRMIKDNISYNNPALVVLQGDLQKKKFAAALRELIKRHETLRTSFETIGEQAVQRIYEDAAFEVEYNEMTDEEAEKRIPWFIRPFDLSTPPLFRLELIKTGEAQYLLMYDLHHIITDGTSMQIFIREFLALYAGNQLPSLKVQYKDFSGWQNRLFDSGEIRKQQEYWLKQFEGEMPVLNIPTDYPRPEIQSLEGNTVKFAIGSETTRALNQLAKDHHATLYMVLLATYNVFLAKLSGQEDIIVGIPVAGRRHADLHFIIGMFVNTLPARNHPIGRKVFPGFLDEIKERTLAVFANQDYPFEELVDQLAVNRDTSRNPLFDVMFVLQNMAVQSGTIPEVQIPGLKTTPFQPKTQPQLSVSKFDMTLVAVETDTRLAFAFEYSTRLFKRETIERFITYFKRIAEDISQHAEKKITDIEMISPEEKNRLLKEFNQTGFDYPGDKTIHELFTEQAKTTPDHIAIVGAQGTVPLPGDHVSITYNELNEKSDLLTHHLRSRGVGPGTIAAIKAERSIELIIGLLGILKAGGAYLPIDPEYPQERIDFMLKDSNSALLLTAHELLDVCRGTAWGAAHPAHKGAPTNLAYIIYTSGTTGTPKGVLIRHRGFINLIRFHRKIFGENHESRVSQTASPGFDAMAFEVWPCLVSGASLYIADNEMRANPARMKEWIIENGITISFQPTMMAEALLEEEWPEQGTALRVLRTAGDRLKKYPQRPYPFRFYNLYGPTEDTVWTTWTEVEIKNEADTKGYPTIGKPIDNHRVYIQSSDLKLQPIGVAGELCIAGEGLAVGYLNNPELTTERFLSVSYRSYKSYRTYTSQKIYKTRDLARWLPDGNIEFLGRTDDQVKIRGYRIEPQEIQTILIHHGDIDDAVVFPVDAPHGVTDEKHLCAYFIPGKELSDTELRHYLSNHLPDYMIPTYFVQIEKIPLTRNGKVDRKALPVPAITIEEEYKGPRNETEKKIVKIWSEVLGTETDTISINADFFQLGGHSLKAAALASRIQKEFNVVVPLIEVFKRNTIESLSEYIREIAEITVIRPSKPKDENLVLLKEGKQEGTNFFLVHAGSGEVEQYIELCARLSPEITCWGFRADRLKNYTPLNLTIETIAQKYIKKLKKLQPKGPYLIAGWCIGATIAIEMVRQLEAAGESTAFFSIINSVPPSLEGAQKVTIEFSLEPEKKWLKKILPWNELKKQLRRVKDMNTLWATIGEYIERVEPDPDTIRAFLPTNILQAIPESAQTSAKQLVYYFNIIRSMDRARSMYIPKNKVKTKLYYLEASESGNIVRKEGWQDYCENKIEYYKVQGDHFSILQNPEVSGTAAVLKKIMMPCLHPNDAA